MNDDVYIAGRRYGAKELNITGTASGGLTVTGAELRIYEDDPVTAVPDDNSKGTIADPDTIPGNPDPADTDTPTVSLAVSPASITENGGVATVTATQNVTTTADTAITVSVSPGRQRRLRPDRQRPNHPGRPA